MKNRDLVISAAFMAAMFVLLMFGTAVLSGTMYGFVAGLGFACMFISMFFWCKFALPLTGNMDMNGQTH